MENLLRSGLDQLALVSSGKQVKQLLDYLQLLTKWNSAYNLTAIRDPRQMLYLHLLDSLSIAPFIQGGDILDVGTGPGLPGIPLAILYPARRFTLMDSNGKKTRFLFQAKTQLQLNNVIEVQSRVEDYQPRQQFDAIASRAFTSLAEMVEKTVHLLTDTGKFYAMKGQYPKQELRALPEHYNVEGAHRLVVLGINAERHLVTISLKNRGHKDSEH